MQVKYSREPENPTKCEFFSLFCGSRLTDFFFFFDWAFLGLDAVLYSNLITCFAVFVFQHANLVGRICGCISRFVIFDFSGDSKGGTLCLFCRDMCVCAMLSALMQLLVD